MSSIQNIKLTTHLFLLLFCSSVASFNVIGQQPPGDKPPTWIGMSIGSSKTGVSQELVNEYAAIVSKYSGNGFQWWKNFEQKISPADRARLETIFKQMTAGQQSQQKVAFIKPAPALKKITPSTEQFGGWKNKNVYGVWINGKKVKNEALNKYSNTDFDQFTVSKLYGFAKQNKKYTHQVDLMTKAYYSNYYKLSMANIKSRMVFR